MRSSRSSWIGALALVVVAGAAASAHRRDEYLQAARLAIDPGRVEIELDLTPGIAVAERVLKEIDRDGDQSISPREGQAYAARVLEALTLEIDGAALGVALAGSAFPTVDAMVKGEGAVRITAAASMPRLRAGTHQVRYYNAHRPDIGVYLANALVPVSSRVVIAAQRRDVAQRELTIDYTLQADAATRLRGGLSVAVTGALIWLSTRRWRRRRETSAKEVEPWRV